MNEPTNADILAAVERRDRATTERIGELAGEVRGCRTGLRSVEAAVAHVADEQVKTSARVSALEGERAGVRRTLDTQHETDEGLRAELRGMREHLAAQDELMKKVAEEAKRQADNDRTARRTESIAAAKLASDREEAQKLRDDAERRRSGRRTLLLALIGIVPAIAATVGTVYVQARTASQFREFGQRWSSPAPYYAPAPMLPPAPTSSAPPSPMRALPP